MYACEGAPGWSQGLFLVPRGRPKGPPMTLKVRTKVKKWSPMVIPNQQKSIKRVRELVLKAAWLVSQWLPNVVKIGSQIDTRKCERWQAIIKWLKKSCPENLYNQSLNIYYIFCIIQMIYCMMVRVFGAWRACTFALFGLQKCCILVLPGFVCWRSWWTCCIWFFCMWKSWFRSFCLFVRPPWEHALLTC